MTLTIRHDWTIAEIQALLELPLMELLWQAQSVHRAANPGYRVQLAYAEIHVTDVFWPDFNAEALKRALLDFQSRSRRFGGLDPLTP